LVLKKNKREKMLLRLLGVFGCFVFCSLSLQAQKDHKVAAIGFYNLENLFDTINNPNINDEDFLPEGRLVWNTEKYVSKQANMARVIGQLATELTPDGHPWRGRD
jgi:Endonuclease/Exonuclease/phosphatase family